MSIILETKDLTKHYGKLVAVNELNVTIRKGEVFGVLGPNGSGKTTTLGMILGVTHPKSGSFEWFQGKHGKNTRKKVGAIIESPIFYPYMTALDNLKIVAKIKKQDYSDIERVLKLVELWDRRKSAFKTFSLGMKQRLAIAAALVGNPDALILDEPTNGLDPQGIAEIRNLIKKISGEGVTIILASHLLDEVQKVCTHVMIMQKGNKLAAGRVDEILSDKHLLEVKAEDMGVLIQALADVSMVEAIKEDRDKLIIEIKAESNADELNKILAHKGVFLSHLLAKEKSLEKFFLEITNKNHV
ncbi:MULTISPECIES: ATP-binding cassette domain-containing protein [unclassified Lentimicrobium]|uniref:ABC transporter ATP-binding protein n=1 Tax=unclassified Lentimicrobium TaxID=2677434 RepID=UPI0015571D4F|nr:ATP-binding cassette domain-containing protein [Lentimicrobium sp. S6]NPD85129.1 ATP-binding cassette domain-containing protein [Lentimicrobium sp. L6]